MPSGEATNALKTGMLKWSKDWVSAASSYESAALAFKQGGDIDNAREAYEQCSAAKLELGQYYAAAQALENSAKLALTQKRGESVDEAIVAYEKASAVYHEGSEIDKAANALKAAAKAAESEDAARAGALYVRACDLLEECERGIMALDTFRATVRFLISGRRFAEAIALLGRMGAIHDAADQRAALFKLRRN